MTYRRTPLALGLALGALIGFGFHAVGLAGASGQLAVPIAMAAFIHCSLTISGTIGLRFESQRLGTLVSVASGLFFAIGLVLLMVIGMLGETSSSLIAIGIVEVIFLLVVYGLHHSGQ